MYSINFRKLALSLAVMAVVTVSSAVAARADSVVINTPNSGLSGTPGPYATVNYVLNGSSIDVTVTMAAGFQAFGEGNGNSAMFGFNVVGSTAGLSVTNLSPSNLTANLGGGNMDGFGGFDVTISCCNPPNAINGFSFTVSRTGGFSSASNLFEASSSGAHFAIHIAPTNGNPTGFAGDTGVPNVPEPASMILFGTGLIGVATGLRRRFKR
jgi:hypothetical protein